MPRSEIRLTQITAWITIAALVTVVMLNNNLINVLIKFYNNIYTKKPLKNKWIYIRKGFNRERGRLPGPVHFGHGRWWLLAGGPGPVKISWQRARWRGSVIKVKTTSKTNHNNNNNYGNNNNNSGCATTTESEFSSHIAHTTCVLRNRKVGLLLGNGPPKHTDTHTDIYT